MVSDHQRKNILVTGGAGFIGSHLCERLILDGCRVTCLDNLQTGNFANLSHLIANQDFDFVEQDVLNPLPRSLGTAFSHIFHLACAASPPQYQADPEHTMLTNVVGTANMLRLAESSGARLILASTSEVYGDPELHPQTEDYLGSVNCTGPRACYDEGKRSAETLTFDYLRKGRCDARVARIFNTYGPRMQADDGRVVSNFVVSSLSGSVLEIYGDGTQTRSFCFISDLVEGLLRLSDSEGARGLPVNLGNPEELTVGELAHAVIAMTSSASRVVYRPLPTDDPKRRRPDITRAKQLLDWEPAVGLEEGLTATIDWFRFGNKKGSTESSLQSVRLPN